jgi:hypothetical protein
MNHTNIGYVKTIKTQKPDVAKKQQYTGKAWKRTDKRTLPEGN